jgi:hypothetical protein
MIRLDIKNDGTGKDMVGNYDVVLTLPASASGAEDSRGWWTTGARVENFNRRKGWAALIIAAVGAITEDLNLLDRG